MTTSVVKLYAVDGHVSRVSRIVVVVQFCTVAVCFCKGNKVVQCGHAIFTRRRFHNDERLYVLKIL
jgi:hypothetical protein